MRVYRGLSGRLLSCGCFVGSYETYSGTTIETVSYTHLTLPTNREV